MTDNASTSFQPSPWPLPEGGSRVLIPAEQVRMMTDDPRTSPLHPHGFGYYPEARGHHMARREHLDDLVIYCVDGGGLCELADERYRIRKGDLLVLPAGHVHRYQADAARPWSIFWMHLGGQAVADWLSSLTRQQPVVKVGLQDSLVRDFRALLDSTSGGYGMDNLLMAASLCQHLLASAGLFARRQANQQPDDTAALHAFMDGHLHQRLTLDDLMQASGATSRFQFIRDYRKRTGQTPMQAFVHRKMSHACYLLEVSAQPVATIGRQLGFDDPYYFSRAFKRVVGVSPARYRQQGRQP